MGIMGAKEALEIAQKKDLDLVEVAPQSSPPVCRIMDYGRFRYKQKMRLRGSRKKQRVYEIKEVKIRIKIGEHDYQVKKRACLKFLERGDKVKVSIMFLGRQITHPELGRYLLDRMIKDTEAKAQVERVPRLEGRNMIMVLAPK